MNKTFFTAAVLLVLVGCNDDKEQTKPAPGEGKITVTAGIEALTRAPHLNEDGSGYFQDGDKIALTVSGGDKTVRYFVLFGYMGQRGIYDTPTNDTLANAGIDRYNIRTNLDMNLFGFLEAKVDVGGRIEDRRYPNRAAGDLWNDLAKYPGSVYPVRNPDVTWTGTPIYNFNPLASIKALGRKIGRAHV